MDRKLPAGSILLQHGKGFEVSILRCMFEYTHRELLPTLLIYGSSIAGHMSYSCNRLSSTTHRSWWTGTPPGMWQHHCSTSWLNTCPRTYPSWCTCCCERGNVMISSLYRLKSVRSMLVCQALPRSVCQWLAAGEGAFGGTVSFFCLASRSSAVFLPWRESLSATRSSLS